MRSDDALVQDEGTVGGETREGAHGAVVRGEANAPDDDDDVAQPRLGQLAGQRRRGRCSGADERGRERQVLDGVARERHLGEHHKTRAAGVRVAGGCDDEGAVVVEGSHGRVDLSQSNSLSEHGISLGGQRRTKARSTT